MGFIQTWRWYGPNDIVSLRDILQAGATGVVSALHHIPVGEAWPLEEIKRHQTIIEDAGLTWEVVESVNVHECIKLGGSDRDQYLNNYRQTLVNLTRCGLKVVCYNFMPVLDWTRTDLSYVTSDGSLALRYHHTALAAFDLFRLKRKGAERGYSDYHQKEAETYWASCNEFQKNQLEETILAGVPGTQERLSLDQFRKHLDHYKNTDQDQLRENLKYFLQNVVPIAEENGVKLGVHPDDPPYSIFGLPRIMSTMEDCEFLLSCQDETANGITLCSGSLGPREENDLPKMIQKFGDRIHFVHLRNVQRQVHGSFFEADHLAGSVDMYEVVKSLILEMARRRLESRHDWRLPMRPDHGHQMLDDLQKDVPFPGYSAIGRLRGLAELRGLEMGIQKGLP